MDDILDPYGDRVMKNVPMIARQPLKKADLWKTGSKSTHSCSEKSRNFQMDHHADSDSEKRSSLVICYSLLILISYSRRALGSKHR